MAYTYGLEKIEISTILGDGGLGTAFSQIGYTNPGTTKIVTDKGTPNEKRCEELSTPLVSIAGVKTMTVEFQLIVTDVNTLPKVLGGAVVADEFQPPDAEPAIEVSLKITPTAGLVWTFPRLALEGSLNATLSKDGDLFYVDCVGTVIQPTKSGEKKYYAKAKA